MTTHVPSPTDISRGAVDILARLVQVLDLADREALHAPCAGPRLRLSSIAIESLTMSFVAAAMLPDQLIPDIERLEVTGADPIVLLRQGEQMTCELPIEDFPAGMSALIVRLKATIGDYS